MKRFSRSSLYMAVATALPFVIVPIPSLAADLTYAGFKAAYLGTLTAAQLDGIHNSISAVLGKKGHTDVYSFDSAPGSSGFASSTSAKGFYDSPILGVCTPTWGSTGTNGTASCVIEGELNKFGSPPEGYTVKYVTDTMAALLAADANATAANFDVFVTQLFTALEANPGDSVCFDGIPTATPPVPAFGCFTMSATTGNWSFSGTQGKITYITTP